jgi:hypothetical protein
MPASIRFLTRETKPPSFRSAALNERTLRLCGSGLCVGMTLSREHTIRELAVVPASKYLVAPAS